MLNAIWAVMILLAVLYGAASGHMSEVTNAALDSAGEAISLCITMAGVVALWMGLMEIAQKAGLIEKLTRGIAPFLKFMFPRIPKEHPAREYIAANIIANVLGLGWACTPAGLKAMEELAKLEAERGNPEYMDTEYRGGNLPGERDIHGDVNPRGGRNIGAGRDVRRERDVRERRYAQTAASGKSFRASRAVDDFRQQGTAGQGRRASNEMCIFLILNISSLQLIPVNMIAYRSQYGSANPTAIIAPAIAATLVSTLVAIVYCKIKDHSKTHTSAVLTASEIGWMSGSNASSLRNNTNVRILRRRDRGGKAI